MNISTADLTLIASARNTLKEIFVPEKHFVVSALRTRSGKIYAGFNLKTTATRASVCAESIALAFALVAHEEDFDTLVTVAYPEGDNTLEPIIVAPCGICRELLRDYAPNIAVILTVNGKSTKVAIDRLLIHPYKRADSEQP